MLLEDVGVGVKVNEAVGVGLRLGKGVGLAGGVVTGINDGIDGAYGFDWFRKGVKVTFPKCAESFLKSQIV